MTAEEARNIKIRFDDKEIQSIYKVIKEAAEDGKDTAYIYQSMKDTTRKRLIEQGYQVNIQPSISMQKDSLYYIIKW